MQIRARMSTSADGYVLASHHPPGSPDRVIIDGDPGRLLDKLRAANRGARSSATVTARAVRLRTSRWRE